MVVSLSLAGTIFYRGGKSGPFFLYHRSSPSNIINEPFLMKSLMLWIFNVPPVEANEFLCRSLDSGVRRVIRRRTHMRTCSSHIVNCIPNLSSLGRCSVGYAMVVADCLLGHFILLLVRFLITPRSPFSLSINFDPAVVSDESSLINCQVNKLVPRFLIHYLDLSTLHREKRVFWQAMKSGRW